MQDQASDMQTDGHAEADVWLARAAEGDAEAWRRIVDTYSRRVFALLVKQCQDRDLAQELTQETFVKVVVRIGRYQEQGKFEAWLFRIAMNGLRDEMRRRKRQARPMDMRPGAGSDEGASAGQWAMVQGKLAEEQMDENPLAKVSRGEEIERMKAAVAQLNEADRQILYMRHTGGLSFAQIAESLDEPLGTVLARGHRALAKLRKILGDQENV